MMFWQILSIEHTKIFRRRLFWVILILMSLLVLVIQIVLYAMSKNGLNGAGMPAEERLLIEQMVTWPGALVNVLGLISGDALGGLFLSILVGAVTAHEYTWRTMHLWLSRGVPRPLLVAAKFGAILLTTLLIVIIVLLTGSAFTGIISAQVNGSLHLDQLNFVQLVLSVARTTFTLLPYSALTFFLAVASRSTVLAISGGMAYALLVENMLMQMLELLGEPLRRMSQTLPAALADSLLTLNQATVRTAGSLPAGPVAPWLAALGIAAWTLFFLGASLWILQRQDLTE